jgi:hypothetical protein
MIAILGGCCGPCFGQSFAARQISAAAGWYGFFAFAGGDSTTLWLIETNIITYYDISAEYGAAFTAASRTVITTVNRFTGDPVTTTAYSPGDTDATAFNARASAEGGMILNQNTIANNDTQFINDYQEPADATNANLLHYQTLDVFTSPNTQVEVITLCHALIDSYLSAAPGCFAALAWNNVLELSYDSGGGIQINTVSWNYLFPSSLLSALNIAANEVLNGPAAIGDAVTLSIGQVLSTFNTWTFFDDQLGNPPAGCQYTCVPSGSPAVLATYLPPADPGDTLLIADPARNYPSPCDASPPPTC